MFGDSNIPIVNLLSIFIFLQLMHHHTRVCLPIRMDRVNILFDFTFADKLLSFLTVTEKHEKKNGILFLYRSHWRSALPLTFIAFLLEDYSSSSSSSTTVPPINQRTFIDSY